MVHIETAHFELNTSGGVFSLRAPLLGTIWRGDGGWKRESPAVAIQRKQEYEEKYGEIDRQNLRDVFGLVIVDGEAVLADKQTAA